MSQQQKSPHEDFIMTFIVVFLVCGISFVIWKVFRLQLLEMLRLVRIGELYLGALMHGGDHLVNVPGAGGHRLDVWKNYMSDTPVGEITNDHIIISTRVAVEPIRVVFVAALVLMSLVVIFKGPGQKYRRRMGLEGLMREQVKSFPAISPFINFDPRLMPHRAPGAPVPAELPLFAEALSPEEWLAFYEISYVGGQVDRNRAWVALGQQLGRRWEGPTKLPLHAQALYAAFALKHVRKRKDCEALLNELAQAWSSHKGLRLKPSTRAKINKYIKDPKIGGALQKFADQHAYETTALLRCLMRARQEGGVLAPSEFLWLRGNDRTLWYPLNNLGRKSYHAEAAGAMVHFTNELIAGQKIPTPRFEEVITGLEAYMKSGAARSIPELDKKAKNPKFIKQKPPKKKK